MNNNIISLRAYIDNRDDFEDSVKIQTFCRLMKLVSDAIEKEERKLIKINLDDININITTGEIILPEKCFSRRYARKKNSRYNTGISLIADGKSTVNTKEFFLHLWY